jgi:hypothetical protein
MKTSNVTDSETDWFDQLEHSSVALRILDDEGKLVTSASCCLVEYKRKCFILSVAHPLFSQKQQSTPIHKTAWQIELKFVPGTGTLVYPINSMEFLCRLNYHNLRIDDVDFCFAQIPSDLVVYSQQFDDATGEILSEIPKTTHKPSFNEVPCVGEIYGFAGQTQLSVEKHPLIEPKFDLWFSIITVVDDLRYIRDQDDYHVFKLGSNHPGHEKFHGCSGAPIINHKGEVVALVCSGDVTQNLIYGVSLKMYRAAIEHEVAKFHLPRNSNLIPPG